MGDIGSIGGGVSEASECEEVESFWDLPDATRLTLAEAFLNEEPTGKTVPLPEKLRYVSGSTTHIYGRGFTIPEQIPYWEDGGTRELAQLECVMDELGLSYDVRQIVQCYFSFTVIRIGPAVNDLSAEDLADPNSEFSQEMARQDAEYERLRGLDVSTFEGVPTVEELKYLWRNLRSGEERESVDDMRGMVSLLLGHVVAESGAEVDGDEITFLRSDIEEVVASLMMDLIPRSTKKFLVGGDV